MTGRRRFLRITAAAASLATATGRTFAAPAETLRTWHGAALGADAQLRLCHPDAGEADRLIALCLAEVGRLEKIFSLYRQDSALSRLNRDGRLDEPPLELVELLSESGRIARLTGGAFDPTVQPLWELFARHFGAPEADPMGPPAHMIQATLANIGIQSVEIAADTIRFSKPNMALTLNGIAQGYITDRVADLLRANGVSRTLVDMGEVRALGHRPDGASWRVGLEDAVLPGNIASTVELADRAVSTSGGYGLQFDPAGRFNHIFSPSTGESSHTVLSVSVITETATLADALSTAFCVMPIQAAQVAAKQLSKRTYFTLLDGSRISCGRQPFDGDG